MNAVIDNFEPLDGSTPKLLHEVTGCRWPVGHDKPQMFCNEHIYHRPASEGVRAKMMSFCKHHYQLAYMRGPYVRAPREW